MSSNVLKRDQLATVRKLGLDEPSQSHRYTKQKPSPQAKETSSSGTPFSGKKIKIKININLSTTSLEYRVGDFMQPHAPSFSLEKS